MGGLANPGPHNDGDGRDEADMRWRIFTAAAVGGGILRGGIGAMTAALVWFGLMGGAALLVVYVSGRDARRVCPSCGRGVLGSFCTRCGDESTALRCGECGNELLSRRDRFCPTCGAQTSWASAIAAASLQRPRISGPSGALRDENPAAQPFGVNGPAIASLALGIPALLVYDFGLGAVALGLGIWGYRRSMAGAPLKGLAIAGIVLGSVAVLLFLGQLGNSLSA